MRIEPYNDSETKEVLLRLLNNEEFISFVKTNLNPNRSKFLSLPGSTFLTLQLFKSKVRKINTIDEFQTQVKKVLESVIKPLTILHLVVLRNLIQKKAIFLLGIIGI